MDERGIKGPLSSIFFVSEEGVSYETKKLLKIKTGREKIKAKENRNNHIYGIKYRKIKRL